MANKTDEGTNSFDMIEEVRRRERLDEREEERQDQAQRDAGLDRCHPLGYISARLRHSGAMRKGNGRIGQ